MSNDTNSGLFSYVTLYECSSLYHKLTFELYENNKLTFELCECPINPEFRFLLPLYHVSFASVLGLFCSYDAILGLFRSHRVLIRRHIKCFQFYQSAQVSLAPNQTHTHTHTTHAHNAHTHNTTHNTTHTYTHTHTHTHTLGAGGATRLHKQLYSSRRNW